MTSPALQEKAKAWIRRQVASERLGVVTPAGMVLQVQRDPRRISDPELRDEVLYQLKAMSRTELLEYLERQL